MKKTVLLLIALLVATSAWAITPTGYNALQTRGTGDTPDTSLEDGDLRVGEDLTVDDDATIGGDATVTGTVSGADGSFSDDLAVTDDADFAQITGGECLIIPMFMASPASPETLSTYCPVDGALRLITYDMEGGSCTAVVRNNTDSVNLASLSATTTHGYTATITSAEYIDTADELKVTITADSSGVGLNVLLYVVTTTAVSPEG